MDTTKTTTHVSLCAGYGGIDLGLSRAIPNLRTIAFSEIEAFACANLVSKMEAGLLDAAPIWTNLKTFPWSDFRDRVDILSGGYPCQPFSAAGKRLGRDDPRHLWPWIADGIVSMRPRICFFENVEGHISLGLREVISELEGLGYATTWGIFSAREVGAPHQRKRVFILAYRKGERLERYNGLQSGCSEPRWESSESEGSPCWCNSSRNTWPSRPSEPQHGWEPPRVVGNASNVAAGGISGDVGGSQGEESGEAQQRERNGDSAGHASEGLGNAKHDGSHQCSEESRGQIAGSKQGWVQESEGGSPSMGNAEHNGLHGAASSRGYEADAGSRSEKESEMEQQRQRASGLGSELCTSVGNTEGLGNSSDWSNGQQPAEQQGWNTSGRSSEESGGGEGVVANYLRGGLSHPADHQRHIGADDHAVIGTCAPESGGRQAEPSLGGDSDGASYRMDNAELYCTTDNRTDELRLLGNGVVPATATRAFLTLMEQLLTENQ